jgi:Uncharacterized protein conserved in bacteria
METVEVITLQRARDFGRRINATFEFIKQNFKGLSKSILVIAGPSVLLSSALMASMANDMFGVFPAAVGNPQVLQTYFMSVSFWLQGVLIMCLFFLSSCVTIATFNEYIILYDEKKTNQIEVRDVWDRVRSSFWMYAGSMVLFFLVFLAAYIVVIMISVIFAMISKVFIFLGILGVYAGIIYFVISSSMTFFIRAYEKKGFFDALSRSFKLIRGEWWSTFGFAFVIYFIMSSLAGLIVIPFYVIFFIQMFHAVEAGQNEFTSGMQWSLIIFFTIYYLVSIVMNMLPTVAIAFQYFNLVEIKEARGLISQFDTIGQKPSTQFDEEQY